MSPKILLYILSVTYSGMGRSSSLTLLYQYQSKDPLVPTFHWQRMAGTHGPDPHLGMTSICLSLGFVALSNTVFV